MASIVEYARLSLSSWLDVVIDVVDVGGGGDLLLPFLQEIFDVNNLLNPFFFFVFFVFLPLSSPTLPSVVVMLLPAITDGALKLAIKFLPRDGVGVVLLFLCNSNSFSSNTTPMTSSSSSSPSSGTLLFTSFP